jgi:glycerol-3-phosphate acyltransferase PlsX
VILAVGDSSSLSKLPESNRLIKITSAKGVPMNVSPSFALRNYGDSSMGAGIRLLSEKRGDVFVSAGNTGAVLAFSLKHLKTLDDIRRPGILVILPDKLNNRILIDAGANAECRPEHLLGFAKLGLSVAEKLLNKKDPSVGLLNLGTEENKGDQLRKHTYTELEKLGKKFYGNVEPHDIFSSPVDVIVTDGFTGNIVLKTLEGSFEFISNHLKRALKGGSLLEKFGALLIKPRISSAFSDFKYQQYGAALLAGLSAPVLIAHGRSDSQALLNAIKYASRIARANPFSSYSVKDEDSFEEEKRRDAGKKGTLF